jgi:cobalt-zinc-cadmium efflux system outer membrane protein
VSGIAANRFFWQTGLAIFMVLSALAFGVARADDPYGPTPEVLTLDAAVRAAVADNPGLDEMRRRADAAATVPSQVGSLPDPRISLGALNVPVDGFALDQEPMTQMQIGVTQSFPFPGTLGLRREWAESRAAAATESAEEARLRLTRDVRNAWWELFYQDRALATIAHNMDLLGQLVEIARTKYEVGRGLQQDVLLAQVELSRLQDMQLQVTGLRGVAAARLNALLGRPQQPAPQLPSSAGGALPKMPAAATLENAAEQSRAAIAVARHDVAAADLSEQLAHKAYLPEFGVSLNYGSRQGRNADGSPRSDFASVMLNFSVPLFASTKQDQLVSQRHAEHTASQRALDETRNRVRAEIGSALASYQQAHDQVTLFDTGILPQTGQAVASMLAGYQVNKVDFLTLVRTQVTLYDQELQRWRALARAHQALATLYAAVGRETFDE